MTDLQTGRRARRATSWESAGVPPHDIAAEESVLGAILTRGAAVLAVALEEGLAPEHFYSPAHGSIFAAMATLAKRESAVDAVLVLAELAADGLAEAVGGGSVLTELQIATPATSNADHYARIVVAHARARRLSALAVDLADAATGEDEDALAAVMRKLAESSEAVGAIPRHLSVTADLIESAEASDPRSWLIPGLIDYGFRVIVTAPEGRGKNVLLRTLAIAAAAGIHPLVPAQPVPPVRTLLVDCENPAYAIAETGRRMIALADAAGWDRSMCQILHLPQGMDLRTAAGRGEFVGALREHRPALVCAGPIYKMFRKGPRENDEEAAIEVAGILDDLRTRYNFALVLEHHVAKGARRTLEAIGSSVWMRWPELGIGLQVRKGAASGEVSLVRWRGDRLVTYWPVELQRGGPGEWPWVGRWATGTFGPGGPFGPEESF